MSCFWVQEPWLHSEVSLSVDSLTLLLVSRVCEPGDVLITSRWCLATRRSSSQVCLSPPSVQDPSDRVLDICRISAPSARVLLLLNAHLPSVQLKKSCRAPDPLHILPCMNNLISSKCSCRTWAEPFRWGWGAAVYAIQFASSYLLVVHFKERHGVALPGAFNGKVFLL